MRTKLWLVLPLVVASIALAQNGTVQGAKGEGAARAADGRAAKFDFGVHKTTRPNGETVVEGRIRFETVQTAAGGRHVLIEGKALRYGGQGNVAEFGGEGLLVTRTPNGPVRHHGHWAARVVDNRRPEGHRDRPDQFRIRFNIANSTAFYDFEGAVLRGDIVVRNG